MESLKELHNEKFIAECVLVNTHEDLVEYRAMYFYLKHIDEKIKRVEKSISRSEVGNYGNSKGK